jgi:hypothetical protein
MHRIKLLLIALIVGTTGFCQMSRQHVVSATPHKEGLSLGYGVSLGNGNWQLKTIQTIRFTNPDKLSNTYSTRNGFTQDVVNLKEYIIRSHFRLGKFTSEQTVTPFLSFGPHISSITFTRVPTERFDPPFFDPFRNPTFTTRKRFYAYRYAAEVMGGFIIGEKEGLYLGVSGGLRIQTAVGTVEDMRYRDNIDLVFLNPYGNGLRIAGHIEVGYRFLSKKEAR